MVSFLNQKEAGMTSRSLHSPHRILISDSTYTRLVEFVHRLGCEWGRGVTMDEAVGTLLERFSTPPEEVLPLLVSRWHRHHWKPVVPSGNRLV